MAIIFATVSKTSNSDALDALSVVYDSSARLHYSVANPLASPAVSNSCSLLSNLFSYYVIVGSTMLKRSDSSLASFLVVDFLRAFVAMMNASNET